MTIAGAVKTFGVVAVLAFAVAVQSEHIARGSSPEQTSEEEGKVTDGLQLVIDTEKDVFVQDEPILMKFHLKNFRQQTVAAVVGAFNYSVDVIDGSGRRILSKEEVRRKELESTGAVFKHSGSHFYNKVRPGDELKDNMDLSKAYSLSPGTSYSIRAKRIVERSDGSGLVTVVSNSIVVTVLQ